MNSTIASLQNIRKQKQLALELLDIERRWYIELKSITRERLGIIKELDRYAQMRRKLDYFQGTLRGRKLRCFTDNARDKLLEDKDDKKIVRKFEFTFDPVEKINLHLPPINPETVDPDEPAHIMRLEDLIIPPGITNRRSSDTNLGMVTVVKRKRHRKRPRVQGGWMNIDGKKEGVDSDSSPGSSQVFSRKPRRKTNLSREKSMSFGGFPFVKSERPSPPSSTKTSANVQASLKLPSITTKILSETNKENK